MPRMPRPTAISASVGQNQRIPVRFGCGGTSGGRVRRGLPCRRLHRGGVQHRGLLGARARRPRTPGREPPRRTGAPGWRSSRMRRWGPATGSPCRRSRMISTTAIRTAMLTSGQPALKPLNASPTASRKAMPAAASSRILRGSLPTRIGAWVGGVLGDEQPAHGVDQETGAAEERQHHEQHPDDGRVDVEVPAESAGDARDVAVRRAAAQPVQVLVERRLRSRSGFVARGPAGVVEGFVHDSIVGPERRRHHRGRP